MHPSQMSSPDETIGTSHESCAGVLFFSLFLVLVPLVLLCCCCCCPSWCSSFRSSNTPLRSKQRLDTPTPRPSLPLPKAQSKKSESRNGDSRIVRTKVSQIQPETAISEPKAVPEKCLQRCDQLEDDILRRERDWDHERHAFLLQRLNDQKKITQLLTSHGVEVRTRAEGRFLASLEVVADHVDVDDLIARQQSTCDKEKRKMQQDFRRRLSTHKQETEKQRELRKDCNLKMTKQTHMKIQVQHQLWRERANRRKAELRVRELEQKLTQTTVRSRSSRPLPFRRRTLHKPDQLDFYRNLATWPHTIRMPSPANIQLVYRPPSNAGNHSLERGLSTDLTTSGARQGMGKPSTGNTPQEMMEKPSTGNTPQEMTNEQQHMPVILGGNGPMNSKPTAWEHDNKAQTRTLPVLTRSYQKPFVTDFEEETTGGTVHSQTTEEASTKPELAASNGVNGTSKFRPSQIYIHASTSPINVLPLVPMDLSTPRTRDKERLSHIHEEFAVPPSWMTTPPKPPPVESHPVPDAPLAPESDPGLEKMIAQAEQKSYEAGFRAGSMAASRIGHQAGSQEGYKAGYQEGHQDGYQDGHALGYQEGYETGGLEGVREGCKGSVRYR